MCINRRRWDIIRDRMNLVRPMNFQIKVASGKVWCSLPNSNLSKVNLMRHRSKLMRPIKWVWEKKGSNILGNLSCRHLAQLVMWNGLMWIKSICINQKLSDMQRIHSMLTSMPVTYRLRHSTPDQATPETNPDTHCTRSHRTISQAALTPADSWARRTNQEPKEKT